MWQEIECVTIVSTESKAFHRSFNRFNQETEREPLKHSSALGSDETVSTFFTFFLFFNLSDVPAPELELLLALQLSLSLSHLFMLHFTLQI